MRPNKQQGPSWAYLAISMGGWMILGAIIHEVAVHHGVQVPIVQRVAMVFIMASITHMLADLYILWRK